MPPEERGGVRGPSGPPLAVLVLRDDKPGHYHQSEGIVAAIARRRPVVVERVATPRPRLPRHVLRRIAAANALSFPLLEALAGTAALVPARRPDLVVSAGGATLVSNPLVAWRHGAANVFSGSLRGLAPAWFSAVVDVDPALEGLPGRIIGLKPSPVDPDAPPPRGDLPSEFRALLIGGPAPPSYRYGGEDLRRMLSFVEADRNQWVVVTSRRTPAAWSAPLQAFAARHASRVRLIGWRGGSAGEAMRVAQLASAVLVTEDSNSMVSEAVAAGRPVLALRPRSAEAEPRDPYLALLEGRRLIASLALEELAPGPAEQALARLQPLSRNHLDLLADELFRAIPALSR